MSMTEDTEPVVVHGRAGLIAAAPAFLGFHPQESLVLMCLQGARRRIGPVARIDLDDLASAPLLARHGAALGDEVVVLVYSESAGGWPLLTETTRRLRWAGVPIVDVLLVRAGRARSVSGFRPGRDETWFSVPSVDHPDARAVAGRLAIGERCVLPDRGALVRSVAAPDRAGSAAAEAAIEFALGGLAARLDHDTAGPALIREALAVAESAIEEVGRTGAVALPTAALLAVLSSDIPARDALIGELLGDPDTGWLPMLISAAQLIPDREATELCVLLALCAYRHGDGALAQVALDRVFAAEPKHRLGGLLCAAMAAGLDPADLTAVATTVRTGTAG